MLLPPRGGVSRLPSLVVASLVILLSAHNVHTQDCNLAEAAIDLIFVVDASGAQGQRVGGLEEWNEHIRFFIKRVADLFTITGLGTHVSVVTYANNGTVNVALNDAAISRADLYNNIDTRVNYRGGDSTNLMNGLQVTNKDVFDVTWGKRREYREFIVILTYSPLWYPEIVDEPNNQDYRFTALELLRISANNLFASIQDGATGDWAIVKVGLLTEPDVTDTLTNGNTSRIYSVSTLSDLSQAVPPLALRICNMLERVVCPSTLDIGLLIDTSDSIRANGDQWPYIQQFLKSFIEQLDIGVDGVHVGAISYSTQAIQVWKLNEYFNKADLSAAIDQFPIQDANTNTAGGLEALDRLFTIENGDRVNVPNVGIVFTDGTSNVRAEDVSSAALVLRQRDIRMISVGITQNVNRAELAVIASDLSMVVLVLTHSELTSRLDRVTQAACEDAVVAPPLACPAKVDILFILDSSSSITYQDSENWSKRVIGFAKAIVGLFDIGEDKARVAAIRFSTDANVEFYLNTDYTKEGIYNRLDAIVNNGGQTNMADAMQLATEEVLTEQNGWRFRNNDDDPPTLVFFITDGQANVNTDRTGLEADRLNDASFLMNVFAIGITDEVNIFELNAVARERENIFLTLNFNRLYQLINDIITKVCTTPVGPTTTTTTTPAPTTTPTPTPTPSRTPVPFSTTTGTTGPPMTTPRFTTPTTSTPEPVECDGRADVVFLIDASGSIEQRNFDLILMFIDSIVNLFNIDNGQIRVGVETYADDYKLEFNLNTYLTKATVQAAVKNIVYTRGVTNTPAALRYLRTSMLTQAAGARDGVTKVAVILTDGESSNRSATIEEAKAAKQAGIHLISLGIGDWLDMHELYAMASYPTTKNMIQVKNFNQLTQVTELIRDAVCDNIDECATNTCNGGTCSNEIGYFWCSCPDGPNTGPNCDTVCTDRQKDVVFVVDASTSVGLENFRLQLDFVTSVVQNLAVDYPSDSGTRVGIVTFADAPREDISLSDQQTRRQLLEDINVMYSLGRTDTAIALRHACSQMFNQDGDRPRADNILVLLTDGKSNNRTATFIEAAACRRKGVTILVVGIGDGVSTIELEGIASDPTSSNIFSAESFTALELLNSQFTQALCNNQDECASNPCQNGGICRNNINGYVCDCPGDWEGKHCDRQCSNRADIIFVLDASGSIRQERFPIIKDFVESIMREFHVGPTKTQFGVAYFSDNAFVQHHLNTYNTNIQDNVLSMKLTPFLTGRTHSKSALDLVRSSMFTTANGDRGSATNIAIFITDGNSNIQAEETLKAAAEARLAGIHIMVIPVGLDFSNMVEISGMVSAPVEQNILFVQEFSELQTIVTNLTLATCEDYDECVSSPCQNGGTCRNMLHMYRCDCPPEFTGVNCQIGCSGSQMDLAIILDLSGSTAQQYQLATEFADELIMGLDMNQDRVRVAVVTYNETAKIEFYLNEHLSDKFSVQNAMRLPHRGGKTNAQAAFNLVHTQIFTESNGDRNGVKDILVFVSDGYSNIEAEQTVPQAMEAKAKDIEIYSVAIGTQPHFTELNEIASQPLSTHIFRLINRAEIMDSVLKLVEALCQ